MVTFKIIYRNRTGSEYGHRFIGITKAYAQLKVNQHNSTHKPN